ncbi:MAG: Na+/H+ antiporter NhaC family protein [Planctomycetaceae bacterium]
MAIVLAIVLRQVILPLGLAILTGAMILAGLDRGVWSFLLNTLTGFSSAIWDSVTATDHVRALVFSLSLGAMVGVLEVGGGMVAIVNRLALRIRSRRGAQTLITCLGLGIFFDDYANTLLVGGTMRTTADRFGISRAKLAYLVDTTSAPVAGLSPISTWVVTEISYVAAGLAAASVIDVSAFALLMSSLPYRFYPLLALVMVFTIAISDRDYGPMRDQRPHRFNDQEAAGSDGSITPPARLAWAAIIPIVGCVGTVIGRLFLTGGGKAVEDISSLRQLGSIISHGDSYGALIWGGMVGLVTTILLHRVLGSVPLEKLGRGAVGGALHMLPAMLILWLAWALSDQTSADQLNTGGVIANWLGDRVPPVLLPTAVFVISSGVAFATGTSWGTMAILTPISMHLAITTSGGQPYDAVALATLGSVLAGAIFGDHCSPISDTTVLSSRASGCDHMTHVRTQIPYAVTVGLISIVAGTIPAAMGLSPYICLLIGCLATAMMVRLLGRKPLPEAAT